MYMPNLSTLLSDIVIHNTKYLYEIKNRVIAEESLVLLKKNLIHENMHHIFNARPETYLLFFETNKTHLLRANNKGNRK